MSVIHITKDNFEEKVLNATGKVLLDFWAPWCGPCQMIGPAIEQIAQERTDVTVGKINVDDEMELAIRFQVTSIPLLVVMENGQVDNKAVGYRPKADIEKIL